MCINWRLKFKKNGFTMVEVIIVIAVICILASIIMPKMSQNRERAKLEACKVNLKHIAIALNIYMNENNQEFPKFCTIDNNNVLVTLGYLKSVPICPGNSDRTSCYEIGGQHWEGYVCCKNPTRSWHPSMEISRPLILLGSGQPH